MFLPTLMLLGAFPPAAKGQDNETFNVITNWIAGSDCTPQSAEPVRLKKLLAKPDQYQGRCICTSGYVRTPALFSSRKDARRLVIGQSETFESRAIGFYNGTLTHDALRSAEGRKATLTGVVGRCSEIRGSATMTTGYCHYTDGAVISLTSLSRQ